MVIIYVLYCDIIYSREGSTSADGLSIGKTWIHPEMGEIYYKTWVLHRIRVIRCIYLDRAEINNSPSRSVQLGEIVT